MNRLWTAIFAIAIVDYTYYNRYFVSGAQNRSCVTHDDSCSVCCVGQECEPGYFPNNCKYGCIDGHRGNRCYELCNFNCKKCDNDNAICESCLDGYYLGDKKDCKSECLTTCKNCSSGTSCITCKEGFYNKDGSSDCRYPNCSTNCVCNEGKCKACMPGFYDISNLCTSKCPNSCVECSSASKCSSCKDGFFNENGQYQTCSYSCRENCTICSSYDVCLRCQPGKFGKQCQNNCSVGCRYNVCEIERGKCSCKNNFSGDNCTVCVSGKYGILCEHNCSNNCDTLCDKNLGVCTEGCKSDTMTGTFCENCVDGRYGISCDDICPEYCLNHACGKENGTCTYGCEKDFQGLSCLGCVQGKYGDECNYDCPDRCKNHECEKQSGHCFNCTGNFDGYVCDICKPGFFGSGCDRICSSRCRNATCDKDSGNCIYGCQDNYSGDKCCVSSENCSICENNSICQKCSPGYYGQTCNQTCSVLCTKNVCEMNTGICTEGCKASSNNMICLRNQGNTQDDTKHDVTDIIIAAVGGATFTLCMLILVMKIKKFLLTRRSHEDTMVLNHIEGSKTEIKNVSNEDKAVVKGNEPYERLGGDRLDMDDHKYVPANVLEIASRETDDLETYVNLQI